MKMILVAKAICKICWICNWWTSFFF